MGRGSVDRKCVASGSRGPSPGHGHESKSGK